MSRAAKQGSGVRGSGVPQEEGALDRKKRGSLVAWDLAEGHRLQAQDSLDPNPFPATGR